MKAIGKNIRYLREKNNLSQEAFGRLFGLTRGQVASYEKEENPSEPAISTVLAIVKYFDISLDVFLQGDFWDTGMPAAGASLTLNEPEMEYYRAGKQEVYVLNERAAAGFPANYNNKSYLEALPSFSFPLLESGSGTYVLLQAMGDSMYPTFKHEDWLLCRRIEELEELKVGECFLVITASGVVVKRLSSLDSQSFVLSSDNRFYGPVKVGLEDVVQFWQIRAKLSFDTSFSEMETSNEVEDIKLQMQGLFSQMEELKKKVGG